MNICWPLAYFALYLENEATHRCDTVDFIAPGYLRNNMSYIRTLLEHFEIFPR
jgi:hypothetical protein